MEARSPQMVKSILVPTDFSVNSENVISYAAALAKLLNARIILFHVYHPPAMISEIPEAQPMDDIEEMCGGHLKKIKADLHARYGPEMLIDCECQCGFAVDEIVYYQEKHATDLIVMGMRGAGYLSERLIGSITTSVIYKAKYPVLAIAENVKFKPVKKIVLACDFEKTDPGTLQPLVNMAQMFGAHIHVLNIVSDAAQMQDISEAAPQLEQTLQGTPHSIHYSENKDIVDGINAFIHAMNIDMAVMIPRTHSLLENIFHEPSTKRMAFHSDVPLLTLHAETEQ